jgi:hypothetical protein
MASTDAAAMRASRWRESRALVLAELAVVFGLTLGHRFVPLSATPFFVALGWISLRLRGLGWRDVGFAWPRPWLGALALGSAVGIGMELLAIFVTEPALARLTGVPADISDLRPLVGNFKLLLVLLVANWVLAAFGEELAFRGYLMNRVAGLSGSSRGAWWLSLVVVSVVFGACHYEAQGITGLLQEGFAGLLLGLLYLACDRRLTVPIVAHGMSNTLAFVLIYFNRYYGL